MDSKFDKLGKANSFTTLNLTNRCCQIEVQAKDGKKLLALH